MPLKSAIAKLFANQDLTVDEAEMAMNVIMDGEATPAQIGSYLTALRMKGETSDEIEGSARAMRSHVLPVEVELTAGQMLVDTCGTGGDGKHTFNISTTSAFVVASCGIKVAKHGNRAASSSSGSADVLLALGGNLDLDPAQVAICIEEINIGFLYAINHHPAMRYAVGPRRELGQRTIFNLLGPLTNPAGATHQLMGIYDGSLTEQIAQVLNRLGTTAALIVHGADGLDELSTTGVNKVSRLESGRVTTESFDPQVLGIRRASLDELAGGTPEKNAVISYNVLSGKDQGASRDIVLLNAAAALTLDGEDWQSSFDRAVEVIDSGAALQTLDKWTRLTNSFAAS